MTDKDFTGNRASNGDPAGEGRAIGSTADETQTLMFSATEIVNGPALGSPSFIGRIIDRYQIVSLLGEGGMGAVFLAERTDDFSMRVALKLIRGGIAETIQRFTRERQILASLQHPGIARLFDGGTASDGTPYIVMEYVEGLPITMYAAQHGLGIRERLALFADVCDAVAYAHQNLIIHRDIKPGNVLVNQSGQSKLLDFGIAGLLNDSDGGLQTVFEAMTPAYASPEQHAKLRLTAATDQYSLGILLYELLTGVHPFESDGTRTVDQQLPPRPSEAASRNGTRTSERPSLAPAQLRSALAGDIDAIVLKALRHEVDQRYATVSDLAADIRRFLAQQPVLARAPSRAYVLSKFVRRRRIEVAAAVVIFATMAFATTHSLLSWRSEREAARAAQSAEREARAINDFLQKSLLVPDHQGEGRDVKVADLLARAVQDARRVFADRPLLRARLLHAVAMSYIGLGRSTESLPLFKEALDIDRELLGAGAEATLDTEGDMLYARSELELPEHIIADWDDYYRRVTANLPEDNHVAVSALNNYAAMHSNLARGRHRDQVPIALQLLDKNLALRARIYGESDSRTITARNNVAIFQIYVGNLSEAEKLMRENLRLQMAGDAGRENALITENNLSRVLSKEGRHTEALALNEAALAGIARLKGDDHPDTLNMRYGRAANLAAAGRSSEALDELANLIRNCGDRPETEDTRNKARALQAKLMSKPGDDPKKTKP